MTVEMGDVMILMLFGALLVCLGFWLCYVFFRHLQPRQRGNLLRDLLLADSVRMADDPEVPEEDEEVEEQPLPMDPDNPPFPRTYNRRPGRPAKFCHCHGRELVDGEEVLFWPNPDIEGAFWLVCMPAAEGAKVL